MSLFTSESISESFVRAPCIRTMTCLLAPAFGCKDWAKIISSLHSPPLSPPAVKLLVIGLICLDYSHPHNYMLTYGCIICTKHTGKYRIHTHTHTHTHVTHESTLTYSKIHTHVSHKAHTHTCQSLEEDMQRHMCTDVYSNMKNPHTGTHTGRDTHTHTRLRLWLLLLLPGCCILQKQEAA